MADVSPPTFSREYVTAELAALGDGLSDPVEAYLMGGGAMVYRGLRSETKDLDVIVPGGRGLSRLCRALTDRGYRVLPASSRDFHRIGARAYVENADGFRFDAFNRVVAGYAVLTDAMKERATPLAAPGSLTVHCCSNEDVFLFKGLASRRHDVADMNALSRAAIDRGVIADEIQRQVEHRGRDVYARP